MQILNLQGPISTGKLSILAINRQADILSFYQKG